MIKAIIFDCFGVLAREMWTPFRDQYFGTSGKDFDWANEQMRAVSKGNMTAKEFADVISQHTGVDADGFLKLLHDNPPNTELFDYIRDYLAPKYKIGFLSNVGADRLSDLFTEEQLGLIDEFALSYDIGSAKPEPKAYMHIAQKLGVTPEDCIFVDDIKKYCVGAEKVGMKSIQYQDMDSFKEVVASLLL